MNRLLAFLLSITLVGPALADSMGSSSGGQAGNQSNQAGCRYNTSPPSLQNGQQVGLQCDINGNLLTSGGGTGGGNVNLTGINGVTPSVGSGTIDTGTLRVVLPTNQPAIPVTGGGGNYGTTFAPVADVTLNSSTATQILATTTTPAGRQVCNKDTAINIYIGTSSATSALGILIPPLGCWDMTHTTAAVYGISASGGPKAGGVQY